MGPPVGHLTPKSSNPGSAKVEGVGHNINNNNNNNNNNNKIIMIYNHTCTIQTHYCYTINFNETTVLLTNTTNHNKIL